MNANSVQELLSQHGVICIKRAGTDLSAIFEDPGSPLARHRGSVVVVEDPVLNNISSSKVRGEARRCRRAEPRLESGQPGTRDMAAGRSPQSSRASLGPHMRGIRSARPSASCPSGPAGSCGSRRCSGAQAAAESRSPAPPSREHAPRKDIARNIGYATPPKTNINIKEKCCLGMHETILFRQAGR